MLKKITASVLLLVMLSVQSGLGSVDFAFASDSVTDPPSEENLVASAGIFSDLVPWYQRAKEWLFSIVYRDEKLADRIAGGKVLRISDEAYVENEEGGIEDDHDLEKRRELVESVLTDKENREAYTKKMHELGYEPAKFLVTFKRDEIDVKTPEGKRKAEQWLDQKSKELKPVLIELMAKRGMKPYSLFEEKWGGSIMLIDRFSYPSNSINFKYLLDDDVRDVMNELERDPIVKVISVNALRYRYKLSPSNVLEKDPQTFFLPSQNGQNKLLNSANEIVVAVIDSGIDYNHPDLKDYIWNGQDCGFRC